MSNYFSQFQFAADGRYSAMRNGVLALSYSDNTHIPNGAWYKLGKVKFNEPPLVVEDREASFQFVLDLDDNFLPAQTDSETTTTQKNRNKHVVQDTISLSLARMGMLSPIVSGQTAEQLLDIKNEKGIVLIPDTNSLYNGTLHWLLNVLRRTTVWLMPFVMSLTQMQAREATLKSLAGKEKANNLPQALRSRALVNAGLSFLERNRHRYQILELDPSLLRYLRSSGKGGFDNDEGEILEDRLLIEGVHTVLRSARTRARQLVVTSDVLLARVLGAEGIPNICLPIPKLSEGGVSSFRYDAWAGTFMGASIRGLIWDFAHAFGSIRIEHPSTGAVSFSCYWPGKQPQDWVGERLHVKNLNDPSAEAKPVEPITSGTSNAEGLKPPEPASLPMANDGSDTLAPSSSARANLKLSTREHVFSDAAIPQSSLPLALRLAGVVYHSGKLTLPELIEELPAESRPDSGNVRRSLEVCRRAKLISFDGETISAQVGLDHVEIWLQRAELDQISQQFCNFKPYQLILEYLRINQKLHRNDVTQLLMDGLGTEVAKEASKRLVRYHVMLGQCWTDGAVWCDGSRRLDMQSFLEAVDTAYNETARDNVAQISEFLPFFCRTNHVSPWALSRSVQHHARVLSERFTFGYAAGGRPTGTDAVITGSLLKLEETSVPMDRFEIGARPVFTLERVR